MVPADGRRRRRRRRPQHLLHPGERRQQALRQPRPPQVGQGPPPRTADRRRRLPGPEGPGGHPATGRRGWTPCGAPTTSAERADAPAPGRADGAGHRDPGRGPPTTRSPSLGPAGPARAGLGGVGHHPGRLRQQLRLLHRPRGAGPGDQPALRPDRRARSSELAAAGTVEVTLLGQNVNSYGRDLTTALRGRPGLAGAPGADRAGVGRAPSVPGPGRCSPTCCGRWPGSRGSGGCASPAPTRRTCARRRSRPWPTEPAVCEHLHLPAAVRQRPDPGRDAPGLHAPPATWSSWPWPGPPSTIWR